MKKGITIILLTLAIVTSLFLLLYVVNPWKLYEILGSSEFVVITIVIAMGFASAAAVVDSLKT